MEKIDNALVTSASIEVEDIEEEYVRIGTTFVSYNQSADDEWVIPQNASRMENEYIPIRPR